MEIREFKIPIVSTDKVNVPNKVKELASKLNARVFHPEKDLSIEEKKELVKDFRVSGKEKEHILDALASALYALKKHKKLIEKTIRKFGKDEKILFLVLRSGKLNPEAAYILLNRDKEEVKKEVKRKYEREYVKLLEEENKVLRNKLRKIKKYIKAYKELKNLKKLVNNLYREMESLKSEKELIERELFKLFMNYMLNKKVVPKYEYAKKYNFPYFYTDDLEVVKKFAGIGKYRIYIPINLEKFVPLSENIYVLDDFEESYLFVFFEKERKLSKIRDEKDVLKRIVEEYRKKRFYK